MGFLDKILDNRFNATHVPSELSGLGITEEVVRRIMEQAKSEDARGPVLTLIGETGVGKSSTINALFNAGREISHVRPCTMEPGEIEYIVDGAKGPIRVIDMPGLGQTIKADNVHYQKYVAKLPGCDVVAWLFQADMRTMTTAQTYLRRLVDDKLLNPERLVVAVNKVDVIQPGEWISEANLPSEEQEQSIEGYRRYVSDCLLEIGIDIGKRIVAYSAKKRYDLHVLFRAMLEACPKERLWVLSRREDMADFTEFVDPRMLSD